MSFFDDLFGGGDRTSVGTSITRVIQDGSLPDAIKAGMINALFREENVPDEVVKQLVGSIGVRAERMYAYAQKSYVNGLPSGQIYSSTQGRAQVEATIEIQENQQVLLQYSHYGPANALHVGWLRLCNEYGYNPATNQIATLSASVGAPVYLQDMVVQVPIELQGIISIRALEQWGVAPDQGYAPSRTYGSELMMNVLRSSAPRVSYVSGIPEVRLAVTYEWGSGYRISTGSMVLGMEDYRGTGDYFQAKYLVNGQTKYWIYKNDSGIYPALDSVFTDEPAVSGTYFPFTYFRYGKVAVNANTAGNEYKTTKRMLKYLGMDIDIMANAIAANPNINDVENALMMFGVPGVSTNPLECRYLFDYFDQLHYLQDGGTSSAQAARVNATLGTDATSSRTIVIKDAKFRMALQNSGINKRLVAGSIGAVGTHTATTTSVVTNYPGGKDIEPSSITTVYHYYRKQITAGVYEQIEVVSLNMVYYIFDGYTTVGDGTNSLLLIPIDRGITSNYSIPDRENLYARSLHIVFNSRVVQHVSWYQTSLFQAVVFIAAIALTVMDMGTDGGSWIATALSLTGTAAVVATVIFNLIMGQVITAGFSMLVSVFGEDVATAIAIAAMVYGGYKIASDGFTQAAGTASTMLQLSNGLQQAVLKSKMSKLMDDATAFQAMTEEYDKLLDTAQDLLENSTVLQPFLIYGEKPDEYYNRSVHYGNIGTVGIVAVSNYVDIALKLPELRDSIDT